MTKPACTSDQALGQDMFSLTPGSLTQQGPSHYWRVSFAVLIFHRRCPSKEPRQGWNSACHSELGLNADGGGKGEVEKCYEVTQPFPVTRHGGCLVPPPFFSTPSFFTKSTPGYTHNYCWSRSSLLGTLCALIFISFKWAGTLMPTVRCRNC